MNTILKVSGFKCFYENSFNLKKITVLTGGNGSGKSSLIQAILLARIAAENKFRNDLDDSQETKDNSEYLIPLNNDYDLQLGTANEVFRDDFNKALISINIGLEEFEFRYPVSDSNITSLQYKPTNISKFFPETFINKIEFYYLNTERLGPRQYYSDCQTNFIHCGYKGQLTAQVLYKLSQAKTYKSAMSEVYKESNILKLVNQHLNEIFPGVNVSVRLLDKIIPQLKITKDGREMLPTNIGFGISYSLPIIVTGLIAKKDTLFIVENPEAHLHPKGQSLLGEFIGMVASSGVMLLVETHSEHIINGIRKSLLRANSLKVWEANIYFFNGFSKGQLIDVLEINFNDKAGLDSFPKDFFDQSTQDMLEIYKLNTSSGNV